MLCPVSAFWGSYDMTFDLEAAKLVFASGRLSSGVFLPKTKPPVSQSGLISYELEF